MNAPRRSGPPTTGLTDPVAGARMWHPSIGYLVIALGLVVAGLVLGWMLTASPSDEAATRPVPQSGLKAEPGPAAQVALAQPATGAAKAPPTLAATPPPGKVPDGTDPTRDLSSYVMRGEKPTMPEVIARLHQAGVHGGLGAFSPPGTRPPMIGLAVPEDFVLPDGYVRHHQATDDGQRIEAILMFAPDRPFFDAAKRPIPVPANRVVPPEYAPPGLPIRRIVIPAPIEPGSR